MKQRVDAVVRAFETLTPESVDRLGEVYATDYRGLDRAIEVRCGSHRLRKAMQLDIAAGQGDACWFALPAPKMFVFDAQSGERIEGTLTRMEAM